MTEITLPASWGTDADFVQGADLVDKADLVGVAFLITGVRFETNARNVEYVYVEAEDEVGEPFDFNDSSQTGVKHQIETYLTSKGLAADPKTGEIVAVKIAVPRGLRLSTYEVTDARGKAKMAKTYYLTGAGRARRAT